MPRILPSLLATVLAAPLASQTSFSPHPSFETNEGRSACVFFAASPEGRYQLADGNLRGRPTALNRISYRLKTMIYSDAIGAGRAFRSITLRASDCDLARIARSITSNATSTPVTVFRGAVTWPDRTGLQSAKTWPIAFPFTTTFAVDGRSDFLADYEFRGGTLANGLS